MTSPDRSAPNPVGTSAAAFENVADRYDAESTYVTLSVWFRRLTWERMARLYPPGSHVLELGCGTGEDAVWNAQRGVHVTATDASPAMLDQTRRKAAAAGVESLVEVRTLDFAEANRWELAEGTYDGVYSNYGALNCIGDWKAIGAVLAKAVRPGGMAGLCLIGRFCPWEIAWHTAHLHFRTAFRRIPGKAIAHLDGRYFPVYYPMPGRIVRDFGSTWQHTRLDGIGVWLPPSDLYAGVGRRKRLANTLLRLEKASGQHWPFKYLGDHYWLELRRV